MLDDLEALDNHLATANISSLAVASYLRLAVLENQTRDVQVSVQLRPAWGRSGSAMTRLCSLQATVAENASASLQPSAREEQLGLVSADLGVLLQRVSQHL